MPPIVQSAQGDVLSHIIQCLQNKSDEVRKLAVKDLRRYVVSEISRDIEAKDLVSRLIDLIRSKTIADVYGGVEAIAALADIIQDDNKFRYLFHHRLNRSYRSVRDLLQKNIDLTHKTLVDLAAKAFGKLVRISPTNMEDILEEGVSTAIEMIQPTEQEGRRYAGVLILRELAVHCEERFRKHIGTVFDNILVALRDKQVVVQEGAATLLASCLRIKTPRDDRNSYLRRLLQEARMGLKMKQPEIIHGSLLTYTELLVNAGMFMRESFIDTAEEILGFKSHRDLMIRGMIMTMIPMLAHYDTQRFREHFLDKTMTHLLTQLRKTDEQSLAFIAIGKIAQEVTADMKPFLDSVMNQIKIGLDDSGRKSRAVEKPIFRCIGMLASAVGPNLRKLLHDLLPSMLKCGLSEPLVKALTDIAKHCPSLLRKIQKRLLELISKILSGQSYKALGTPTLGRTRTEKINTTSEKDIELIILALKTLGSFNFTGHALNEFVRTCASSYLGVDNPQVRAQAAETCCKLFERDPICYQASSHAIEVISEVLAKLLTVGIADPDPHVRAMVLRNLPKQFDQHHLAQPEILRSVFMALNDEEFDNRKLAVELIGRLANHNPAYVLPSLRRALIRLLTELEYSTIVRIREECVELLACLIDATQGLIKPYALAMLHKLRELLKKDDEHNPTVATNILKCLGGLTSIIGEDATYDVIQSLMQIIIPALSDLSPLKRDAALHTLGQVCSSTRYVIKPLMEHPKLLPLLEELLKAEQIEAVKVLGILGALDPVKFKSESEEDSTGNMSALHQVTVNQFSSPKDWDLYFHTVVITALLNVLKCAPNTDEQTSSSVIDAIMLIFKTQGLNSMNESFLPQIIPAFIDVVRASHQEYPLQQLAVMVGVIKQHVQNYLGDIYRVITELWDNTPLQHPIVSLIEALGKALPAEFRPFLPTILPLVLKIFDDDMNEKRVNTHMKILDAFLAFGTGIEEYLHLVIPAILKSYERTDGSDALKKHAVQTINRLSKIVNIYDHASRIILSLVRVLEEANNEVQMAVLDTLCSLVIQLGSDFEVFVPTINKSLVRNHISHPKYESLMLRLLNGERLLQGSEAELLIGQKAETPQFSAPAELSKMSVNQQRLKQVWDAPSVSTWFISLGQQLITESPSLALRACKSLALDEKQQRLVEELFNAAFISCWTELDDQYKMDLGGSVERAIKSKSIDPSLCLRLLDLCEFMERKGMPLPIEIRTLGRYAMEKNSFAKAVYYKELEYFEESSPLVIEHLVILNTRLQQRDTAIGTLMIAQSQHDGPKHKWYEKLGRWQDALHGYEKKALLDPDARFGRMKCLHALGEWDTLAKLVEETWPNLNLKIRGKIARMAAAAAWSLNQWEAMDDYIANIPEKYSADRAFYSAITHVHRNQFPTALSEIKKARQLSLGELRNITREGYRSSYSAVVRAQELSELEEIITFKQSANQPDRQHSMKKTWMMRLQGCLTDVEIWQRILQVRTLVLNPEKDPAMWIKFANLCRKSERMQLAEKTFKSLIPPEAQEVSPSVVYAHLKYLWATGSREETLGHLRRFTESLDLGYENIVASHRQGVSQQTVDELSKLLARCYFKQAEWQVALWEDWRSRNPDDILQCYLLATVRDPEWNKAWHTWALANTDVISHLVNQPGNRDERTNDTLAEYVIQALRGFFQSIRLRNSDSLQDTLRILTLWFKFGTHDEVSKRIAEGFSEIHIQNLLHVIPQIIARVQTIHPNMRANIERLLTKVGKLHPQALIFPLTVASKSSSEQRKKAALSIMDRMKEHSPNIVQQAELVSRELIRVAILWPELWFEGLEEASRLCVTDGNAEGMIGSLERLHKMIKDPTTPQERLFVNLFGNDLREAWEACRKYRRCGDATELDKAWEKYQFVYKKLERQLQGLKRLDLGNVSPNLLRARDLEIAVPGTYQIDREPTTITRFGTKLTVIGSKQKPRKLSIEGNDGREYQYILKGHEDLRQDERVMQLFSLVNTLLSLEASTYKRRLHIERYSVIPLAPNAGLLGWVQDSDTLHALIRDHRDPKKIPLELERNLMRQVAEDVDLLMFLQKVEVFEYALENTTGNDLYSVLWLKSVDTEHWLARRTTYTRSLAVNSMVGHILGLGDRHPSNLLLGRRTGKVVHIDFGDCFEVAMHREVYPEKIPFRLTRMLTHAMEVSGIEGSFRKTCEITMRVLRDEKESLMAVLEAFVYDPLINWRLVHRGPVAGPQQNGQHVKRNKPLPHGPTRKMKADENDIFNDVDYERNERAMIVYNRVQNKLTGRDFNTDVSLSVDDQVQKLIEQATSLENLAQCFAGWCPFW